MKATIVDFKGTFAAALSDDGCISKIKNNNYAIGQVIEMKKTVSPKFKRIVGFVAVAASLMILCGFGAYAYYTPSKYVSLDVNPSIEYSLNMFDRVLSAKAVNDDGSEILKEINLDNMSNKTIDHAIAMTVKQIAEDGYFDGDVTGGIVITTSGKDLKKANELADELKQVSEETIKDSNVKAEVEAMGVGKKRVDEARALGVTPGKLNLVEKYIDSAQDPDSIDMKEWLNKPVKEIMKATKENKKAEQAASKSDKTDSEESDNTSSTQTDSTASSTTSTINENESQGTTSIDQKANISATSQAAKNGKSENGKNNK